MIQKIAKVPKKIQTGRKAARVLRRLRVRTRHLPPDLVTAWAQDSELAGQISASTKYRRELEVARAQIACVTYLALTLWRNDSKRGLMPSDWLGSDNVPNADIALGMGLCELANYNLSVICLAERGLVGPARSLTRLSGELCSILTVLIGDRDAFRRYVSMANDPDKLWYELFSKGKLARRLETVERTSGVPEELIETFREYRRGNARAFSRSVQQSWLAQSRNPQTAQ